MATYQLTRRSFLQASAVATAGVIVAACQPQVVKETVEVEKVVEKEKVVTATPEIGCQKDWNPTLPPAPKKYDPPVEIEAIFSTSATFVGDDNYLSNPMTKRLKEHLGIVYKMHYQAAGAPATQRLRVDMAAGTLPDYFFAREASFLEEVIENEVIEDIRATWEATASPLLIS